MTCNISEILSPPNPPNEKKIGHWLENYIGFEMMCTVYQHHIGVLLYSVSVMSSVQSFVYKAPKVVEFNQPHVL